MSDAAERYSEDEEIKQRVIERFDALDAEGKRKVLDFSEELAARGTSGGRVPRPVGKVGGALLAFAGTIPKEDLDEMEKIIEEEFGKVDEEGW